MYPPPPPFPNPASAPAAVPIDPALLSDSSARTDLETRLGLPASDLAKLAYKELVYRENNGGASPVSPTDAEGARSAPFEPNPSHSPPSFRSMTPASGSVPLTPIMNEIQPAFQMMSMQRESPSMLYQPSFSPTISSGPVAKPSIRYAIPPPPTRPPPPTSAYYVTAKSASKDNIHREFLTVETKIQNLEYQSMVLQSENAALKNYCGQLEDYISERFGSLEARVESLVKGRETGEQEQADSDEGGSQYDSNEGDEEEEEKKPLTITSKDACKNRKILVRPAPCACQLSKTDMLSRNSRARSSRSSLAYRRWQRKKI